MKSWNQKMFGVWYMRSTDWDPCSKLNPPGSVAKTKFFKIPSKYTTSAHLRRAMLLLLRGPLATREGSLSGVLVPLLTPAGGSGSTELVSMYVWTIALLFCVALWCHWWGSPMSMSKPSTAIGGVDPAVPLMDLLGLLHQEENIPENALWELN